MAYFEYLGKRYELPSWPPSVRAPTTAVIVRLADGSAVVTEPDAQFLTSNGWVSLQNLLGENILVEPISSLSVISSHLHETGNTPVFYTRTHSKYILVTDLEYPAYPIGAIGFVPSPANGGPTGDPAVAGSLGPCLCVLSERPCGEALMLPLVITGVAG